MCRNNHPATANHAASTIAEKQQQLHSLLGADPQRQQCSMQLLLLPLLLLDKSSILWLAECSSHTASTCRRCSHDLHRHSKRLRQVAKDILCQYS